MWIKIAVFLSVLSVFGASLYWAQKSIDERAKLEVEIEGLLQTNKSMVADNDFLRTDAEHKEAFLLEREGFIEQLSINSDKLKGELADAKNKLPADVRICLESDMPKPYINKLRQRTRKDRQANPQNMSLGRAVPAVFVQPI